MIKSTKSEQIKYMIKLQQKARFRKKEGLFVIEGVRLLMEAPFHLLEKIYLSEEFEPSERFAEWMNEVSTNNIPIETVGKDAYSRMSQVVHSQGVMALVRMPSFFEGDDFESALLKLKKESPEALLLVFLEDLQDPGNAGTILRTAEAAGASCVVTGSGCVDLYSPKVVRSTMGSIFRLPHIVSCDFYGALDIARKEKVSLYGAALSDDALSYDSCDLKKSCGILIGNEGAGLSKEAMGRCDAAMLIPMLGRVESLNAGMAAGVILFEAARQRRMHANLV